MSCIWRPNRLGGCYIYRPGTIIGHSQTGAAQTNDLIARLIKGLMKMGIAPKLDLKLSLTPVDYVARSIVHLSQQPASWGKAFHLTNPQALPLRQLVGAIEIFGYSIQWTDYEQWQTQLVKAASKQDSELSPLVFLLTEWVSENQRPYLETAALVSQAFDCRNTLAGLAGSGIACPTVDTQVLRSYLSYLSVDKVPARS